MPFNKGDFTQQGVAGHVNANLRLNEKRLVNIDLTSNEEAEGCTINGTVKDLLNDKVYPIGAGVSGNIEITENGENINVAPYATAAVNVTGGGGDIKTLRLTINATGDNRTAGMTVANIANGLYHRSAVADISSPVEIAALIEEVPLLGGGVEYAVHLSFSTLGKFTNNNTGTNCEILFNSEYPKELIIVVTDIDSPASAVINVTTSGAD